MKFGFIFFFLSVAQSQRGFRQTDGHKMCFLLFLDSLICLTIILQPIDEIFQRVKNKWPHILLHTDAAQALGKIPVNVNKLHADYLTIVGHKVHAHHFD